MVASHCLSLSIAGALMLCSLVLAQSSEPKLVATDRFPSAALLVVENLSDGGVARRRQLVRFPVSNGQLVEKTVVFEADQGVFGHFGGHKLFDNRFIVMQDRAVYDLESGRLAAGRAADEAREAVPVQARGRVNSPHGLGWVEVTIKGALVFHSGRATMRLLGTDFGYTLSPWSSGSISRAPVAWIDARQLVTQRENGELLLVDLEGNIEPFVSIENVPQPVSSPTLSWDPAGRLIYTCGDSYVIDVKARAAKPSRWWDLGHGFTIERELPEDRGRIVRYRGKEIGRFVCVPYRSKATMGRIAIACAPRERLGYPDTLRVWDAEHERWTSSKLWINSLVGWVRSSKPATRDSGR